LGIITVTEVAAAVWSRSGTGQPPNVTHSVIYSTPLRDLTHSPGETKPCDWLESSHFRGSPVQISLGYGFFPANHRQTGLYFPLIIKTRNLDEWRRGNGV